MSVRKTWQEKATAAAIRTKVSRKRNPVTTLVQLAKEFGAPVAGPYFTGDRMTSGPSSSHAFRNHVRNAVGTATYNRIVSS